MEQSNEEINKNEQFCAFGCPLKTNQSCKRQRAMSMEKSMLLNLKKKTEKVFGL